MFKPALAESPNLPVTFPKLVSPKLDGIRCVTKFGDALTRSLKPIANHYIRETLRPYQNLDGEIIIGAPTAPDVYRSTFSGTSTITGVPQFAFYVFDDLGNPGTFEQRLDTLRLMSLPPFIKVLPQRLIQSQAELDSYYGELLAEGYEGAIARDPKALYKHGRYTEKSQGMLKIKPFADSEALVLGVYEANENTNEAFTNELGRTERSTHAEGLVGKGMIGGFYARDIHSGLEFKCAAGKTTHAERIQFWTEPPKGTILKYRHMPYGLMTNGQPRFARFIGWRDLSDM